MLPLNSLLLDKIFLLLEIDTPKHPDRAVNLTPSPETMNSHVSSLKNQSCCGPDQDTEPVTEKRLELLEELIFNLLTVIGKLAAKNGDFSEGYAAVMNHDKQKGADYDAPESRNTGTFNSDCSPLPTRREKEVLILLTQGYCAKEIAKRLFISETTVITHKRNLKEKFKAKNTVELISKTTRLELSAV